MKIWIIFMPQCATHRIICHGKMSRLLFVQKYFCLSLKDVDGKDPGFIGSFAWIHAMPNSYHKRVVANYKFYPQLFSYLSNGTDGAPLAYNYYRQKPLQTFFFLKKESLEVRHLKQRPGNAYRLLSKVWVFVFDYVLALSFSYWNFLVK